MSVTDITFIFVAFLLLLINLYYMKVYLTFNPNKGVVNESQGEFGTVF